LINVGFVRAAAEMLPKFCPIEFFRPAQMDRYGNFNNIAFGKNYYKPRLRLPGTGGIADLTTFISNIYLYVPRHSRITFVEHIDFLSGLGHNPLRKNGYGPRYLVTDLGQFDFMNDPNSEKCHLRLTSIHPGVTINRIKARTGFDFDILPNLQETSQPTEEEIRLLREEIDPHGIRRLEMLSGASRRQLIWEIIQNELHGSNRIH